MAAMDALEAGVHDHVHYDSHEHIKPRLQEISPVEHR